MPEEPDTPAGEEPRLPDVSPWRVTGWLCAGVIAVSVLACVAIAAARSEGLVAVRVTALDADAEPRDHRVPLVKQKEALPDYEVIVKLSGGDTVRLGAKPDTSAVDGLTWRINDPVSVADIAGVRLREEDKLISDAVAEVQITGETVTQKGYRFEFVTERSAAVGVESFFRTPVGRAIAAAFTIAVLLFLASIFCA